MRYQALKKKTFLAAATFTGIAVLFPVLCMAASENDVQTYTDGYCGIRNTLYHR